MRRFILLARDKLLEGQGIVDDKLNMKDLVITIFFFTGQVQPVCQRPVLQALL